MSILSKIQSLITAANNTTGESDATLTDAVQTLVDGYGQGGGVTTQPLSVTVNGTYTAPAGEAYTPVTVNVPTGGSLPSVISKIDGGSFTLASDTEGGLQSISHSLGVVPKGFVIWTEDELSGIAATRYIANCVFSAVNIVDKNSNNYVASGGATITYNGNASMLASNMLLTSAIVQNYMDASRIRCNNALIFYKAGCQYKWLAWA